MDGFFNIYQGKRVTERRPETIRNLIVFAAIGLFIGYQVINVFIPNAEMIIYVRILGIAANATALYIFAGDAWRGVWRATPLPRDFLICGIWLKFLADFLQGIYALVYRLAGTPAWFLNSEILSPIIMLGVVAVVLHMCVPGTVEGVVPRRNQYALAAGFGIAVLLVGFLIASKPDIRPYIERARPYISDWWRTGSVEPPAGKPKAAT